MADFNLYQPNWSVMVTGDISSDSVVNNVFDNSLNTYVMGNPEVTFTTPTGHPFRTSISKLRIYCTRYVNGGSGGSLIVNGTDYTSSVNTSTRSWLEVNVSSLNDIKWTKEGAADSDYASNSYVLVFAIEVDDTILVNAPHLTGGVVSGFSTVQLIANTNTDVISPTHSGSSRSQSTATNPLTHLITNLSDGATGDHSAERGFLRGRRPHRGLQYPRGYYNK